MKNLDIKNYLYHGIVDWENYNNGKMRYNFCLAKLESILRYRYIYRPCDFKKHGINHDDCANLYTYYFTFAACHSDSIYSQRFKKEIQDDNGYVVATNYAKFGILLDPKLLDELIIKADTFCDKEIIIEDNISIDKYGVAIYINPLYINEEMLQMIANLLKKYNYTFNIVSIIDGSIVKSIDDKRIMVKKLSKKVVTSTSSESR